MIPDGIDGILLFLTVGNFVMIFLGMYHMASCSLKKEENKMKLLEKLFGKTTDDSYKPRKAVWARITNVEPDDETYVKITLEPTDSTVNVSFPPIQIRNPVEDTEEYRKLKCVYEACDLRILPRDDIVSRELLLEHMRHRLVGSTLPIMEPEPEPERKACPVTT